MRLISWNVNGIRACMAKGFMDFFREVDSDIFALQETKMKPDQLEIPTEGYEQYWNSADKKGYSGTALFTRKTPVRVENGLGIPVHDTEGRVITAEYDTFYLVTVYTPNSKEGLARLPYRMEWEDAFRNYVVKLDRVKPVILCGDFNVAHEEIDLKNPKTNRKNAGFSDEEREKMTGLLQIGFIDSFRYLYPNKVDAYSWWSYRFRAREHNAGWRIDYFLISERLKDRLRDSILYSDVLGSDHCPVGIEIDL